MGVEYVWVTRTGGTNAGGVLNARAAAGGGIMISAHIHHRLPSSGGLRALTGAMSALQVGIHASSGRFTDLKTAVAPGAATRPSSGRVLCAMWPIEAPF